MTTRQSLNRFLRSVAISLGTIAVLFAFSINAFAQTEAEVKEAFIKALTLVDQNRLSEAVPYLAIVVKEMPDKAEIRAVYGLALLTKSKQIPAGDEAKRLSAEALVNLEEARRLGFKDAKIDTLIEMLGGRPVLNQGVQTVEPTESEKYMQKAETYFAQSKYDEALGFYQKALAADPKNYEAALYSGDVYVARLDWPNAEKMYQQAIAIDPERETAYRYSATPLMKQKKYDQALERYIEAYITEPYSERSPDGISQWAQITGSKVGHPEVKLPKPEAAGNGGSSKWEEAYLAERAEWRKSKFALLFPGEKVYRHTAAEEAEAIRSALRAAKESKITSDHIATLQNLDDAGFLEAFVYISLPDESIAADYPAYLKANRPKLRQYVSKFMISK